jgi:hypothetical protein
MPVRSTIHSSDVSTVSASSSLDTRRAGSADPVPAMITARITLPPGLEIRQILAMRVRIVADHLGGDVRSRWRPPARWRRHGSSPRCR